MPKDWIGDNRTAFRQLGASNHSDLEREENDFYATDPSAIDDLLRVETFSKNIRRRRFLEREKENCYYSVFIAVREHVPDGSTSRHKECR